MQSIFYNSLTETHSRSKLACEVMGNRCALRIASLGAALIIVFSSSIAFAQYNSAEISGLVSDQRGAAIVGATVVAVNSATGLRVERTTDSAGRYHLPSL